MRAGVNEFTPWSCTDPMSGAARYGAISRRTAVIASPATNARKAGTFALGRCRSAVSARSTKSNCARRHPAMPANVFTRAHRGPEALIFDAVRTPRGKGKKDGALHHLSPLHL